MVLLTLLPIIILKMLSSAQLDVNHEDDQQLKASDFHFSENL